MHGDPSSLCSFCSFQSPCATERRRKRPLPRLGSARIPSVTARFTRWNCYPLARTADSARLHRSLLPLTATAPPRRDSAFVVAASKTRWLEILGQPASGTTNRVRTRVRASPKAGNAVPVEANGRWHRACAAAPRARPRNELPHPESHAKIICRRGKDPRPGAPGSTEDSVRGASRATVKHKMTVAVKHKGRIGGTPESPLARSTSVHPPKRGRPYACHAERCETSWRKPWH
jgi:hypothetical protein